MSRLQSLRGAAGRFSLLAVIAVVALLAVRETGAVDVGTGLRIDLVVTGMPRPDQLAFDRRGRLVALGRGASGDTAGELYRFDLRDPGPIEAGRAPRVVIPFADPVRKPVFGSLAVDPSSADVFLGEENGNRIYRLGEDQRLQVAVVGLNHLLGGSALALDGQGRLVFLDYASPETQLRSETPLPPSLDWLVAEGYRGPLVYRVDPREDRPLPRRADLLAPVFPRPGSAAAGQEPLWRLIGVVVAGDGDLVLLSSVGEVFRLGADARLRLVTRLPGGHYHRTNLAVGPDGSIFVCGGFQIRQIYRIAPSGGVAVVARDLGDPAGIAFDGAGTLYVAETALHRIIRITGLR